MTDKAREITDVVVDIDDDGRVKVTSTMRGE